MALKVKKAPIAATRATTSPHYKATLGLYEEFGQPGWKDENMTPDHAPEVDP